MHCVGVSTSGSSPLTRGKPRKMRDTTYAHGLIPTHAGKTQHNLNLLTTSKAHPHSRGENPPAFPGWKRGRGSSPLTRGKRELDLHVLAGARLIPTHAGKTPLLNFCHACQRAHPHSRGENA